MIPYGKQQITEEDIKAVTDVLQSPYLTQGPVVPIFEEKVSSYVGSKYGIAVNSATSALHIACLALDLAEGDILWTSPITFVASANCGLYCGAKVDFVDIDPKTYNICIKSLEAKLHHARLNSQLPKILIPVHLSGQSCDMKRIKELSIEYGFKIIEDASHAIGGNYRDTMVGSCSYSDICVFSFHPVKIITTAEGGLATTNSPKIAEKLNMLRTHGITKDKQTFLQNNHGPWYYEQQLVGFNYRMTEIQAALGISQMDRINEFIDARNELANRYNSLLKDLPLKLPSMQEETFSSYHLYIIRLKLDLIKKTHLEVFTQLRENGIGVNLHYIPVFMQPVYQKLGFNEEDFPESKSYYQEAISIPIFHGMSFNEQDRVVEALTSSLK